MAYDEDGRDILQGNADEANQKVDELRAALHVCVAARVELVKERAQARAELAELRDRHERDMVVFNNNIAIAERQHREILALRSMLAKPQRMNEANWLYSAQSDEDDDEISYERELLNRAVDLAIVLLADARPIGLPDVERREWAENYHRFADLCAALPVARVSGQETSDLAGEAVPRQSPPGVDNPDSLPGLCS